MTRAHAVVPEGEGRPTRRKVQRMSSRQRERFVFNDFSRWGFDERGWLPSTRNRYVRDVLRFDRWCVGNCKKTAFSAGVHEYRKFLFELPANARTRNRMRQALMAWGDYLVQADLRDDNPATGLPRLREPVSVPRAMDVEQSMALASVIPSLDPQEQIVAALFLYQGLRKSEVRLLRWSDFDNTEYLYVRGKGDKTRVLPVHRNVVPYLTTWRRLCVDPEWVVPSVRLLGQPISETGLRDMVYRIGDAAGLERLNPHKIRHTFATSLVESGADLRTVQEALGHADPKTTAIYTKVRPARLREAIERLDYGRTGDN